MSRPNHRHNSQPGAWHSLVDYSDSDDSVNDDDNDDGADSDPRCAHGKPVRPATSPSTFWNPFTNTMESIVHSYAPVTAIAVSLPFVICAHKDNSIQVYTLAPTMASRCGSCSLSPGQVLELSHVKTIHGHAAHVTAVAIVCGRLLTGAADGIKVWDFPSVNGTRLVYSMPFADSIPLFVQQCMSPEPSAARPGAAASPHDAVMASVASHLHMSLAASRATLLAIPDAPMVTIATSGSDGDIDIDIDSDGGMCPPVPVWLGFDLTRVVVLSLRQTPSCPAPTVQVLSFQ
ncbi:hypothetical protein BC831DRAFT_516220 [Entophlyctis helioformis]|nr:hypothetical protein BC831DRAFT_516220 [Entophlyctis helioformis]